MTEFCLNCDIQYFDIIPVEYNDDPFCSPECMHEYFTEDEIDFGEYDLVEEM